MNVVVQMVWAKDFYERLTSDDLAKGVTEAECLLASHKERKVCVVILTTDQYIARLIPCLGRTGQSTREL